MKCYLPKGDCIRILTAVWAFSACEQNNRIILEVILLFRRLTRTVQAISRERLCLKGLKVSACLEMGWSVLTDPNSVNRGWCDVWQITYVGFSSVLCICSMSMCRPGGSASCCTYYRPMLQFERRLQWVYQIDTAHMLHQLQLWSCITSASGLSLSFYPTLCLFFVKINLRAMLSSQLATQRDAGLRELTSSCNDECAAASLTEGLFSLQSRRMPVILTPQYV